MNLSELQEEAGRLLADANHSRWSTDVLTLRLNQAQKEVQGYTNAVKTSESLTPVAGVSTLSLNSNTMDIVRSVITRTNGDVVPFIGISYFELETKYPNWKQWAPGEPKLWWYNATTQELNLVPVPDSNNAITNGITVWGSRVPEDMSNSTDLPFDSNNQMIPFHMAIVHWTVSQCWMDDGTPESLGKAKFHKSGDISKPGQYELQLKRLMEKFDAPENIGNQITFIPEGGRIGFWGTPSKSFPLG